MSTERILKIAAQAEHLYNNGDPGHDLAHVNRVVNNCRQIAARSKVKLEYLEAAAFLHDIVNLPKNHHERAEASARAAAKSREILADAQFLPHEIEAIVQIISEHSYSRGLSPSNLESAILQDADRLDALGAIGIMRLVSTGTQMGSVFYDIQDPQAKRRELNDKKFIADHIGKKLMKLPDMMNTQFAKEEAKKRMKFVDLFVQQLHEEIQPIV